MRTPGTTPTNQEFSLAPVIESEMRAALSRIQTALSTVAPNASINFSAPFKIRDLNPAYDGDPDTEVETSIKVKLANGSTCKLVGINDVSYFKGESSTHFNIEIEEVRYGTTLRGAKTLSRNDLPGAEQELLSVLRDMVSKSMGNA